MALRTDKNLRAGLYARVSTEDRGQDPETQLRPLREYAKRRGFRVVGEFVDHASGTTESRPNYRRLFEAVLSGLAPTQLVVGAGPAIAPPLTGEAGGDAVYRVRQGSGDAAIRAHGPGLPPLPLPRVWQAVQRALRWPAPIGWSGVNV